MQFAGECSPKGEELISHMYFNSGNLLSITIPSWGPLPETLAHSAPIHKDPGGKHNSTSAHLAPSIYAVHRNEGRQIDAGVILQEGGNIPCPQYNVISYYRRSHNRAWLQAGNIRIYIDAFRYVELFNFLCSPVARFV